MRQNERNTCKKRTACMAALLLAAALLFGCAAPLAAAIPAPAPTASPSATPGPTLAPTPSPTPSPTPAPTPFSIAWITDTQTLSLYPSLVPAIVPTFEWVKRTREEYNTVALVHTGDLVENGRNPAHWARINAGIEALGDAVPFFPVAGNHDAAKSRRSYDAYLSQPFIAAQTPAQQYRGGEGSYLRFSAGGLDFLLLGLGYYTLEEEALAWARGVFDGNPDCVGILAVHSYLSYQGEQSDYTAEGAALRKGVVAQCKNVRLVLCGHVLGNALLAERYDDDGDGEPERTVNCMRHNYQFYRWPDTVGFLRMLTFDPVSRGIRVSTYSPFLDKTALHPEDADEENFTLENAF